MAASRLIVKGLPGNTSETRLRAEFGEFGRITDCTLKYTKEGKFRRFAFVGFDSDEAATQALERRNGTFVDSSKITVEICKGFGDETKPRAWSKYAKGSSAYKRAHPDEADDQRRGSDVGTLTPKKVKADRSDKFKEFLSLQKTDSEAAQTSKSDDLGDQQEDDLLNDLLKGITGDTSMSLVLRGFPSSIKQKSIKEWLNPIRVKGVKLVRNENEAAAFVSFAKLGDVRRVLLRNEHFLGGFKVKIRKVIEDDETTGNDENAEEHLYEDRKAEEQSLTNAILETGRLFLRNLSYSCTEDDLLFLLKKYGEVAELEVIVDRQTNRCKGFAIATFMFPENAVAAYSALDGTVFQGRMLHILAGEEKREKTGESAMSGGGRSAFQAARLAKLKANAGRAHSWNALFLGANAVADTLAAKLGTEKSDLLSSEGETSAGVRLALAETRLVRETRDFLVASGVSLDAFSRPAAKRSDSVILVKNLPAKVDGSELERMFERFGPIKKLIFPPEAISAIVEMTNSVDARKAFNGLAYARFRSQPLYLEWAPVDIFAAVDVAEGGPTTLASSAGEELNNGDSKEKVDKKAVQLSKEEKKLQRRSKKHRRLEEKVKEEGQPEVDGITNNPSEPLIAKKEVKEEEASVEVKDEVLEEDSSDRKKDEQEDDGDELEPLTTLFVKNLNFQTTDETLKSKFASKFKIRSAVVSKKRDPKDPSKALSMGFGFVQFCRANDAQTAIKEMQGLLLDGHSLELKLSHRENAVDVSRKRKSVEKLKQEGSTKMLVRNVPFQASRKEVKALFSTFGELRAFRMPKKVGSAEGHRGFGFVDFLTRADAARAFDALVHSTHLYGRRLVLEWANTEQSLDELREKTASAFGGDQKEMRKQKRRMQQIEKDVTALDDD